MERGYRILLAFTVLFTFVSGASAIAPHEAEFGSTQTIALTDAGRAGAIMPVVRVTDRSDDGVQLEFELPALTTQPVTLDGETFNVLSIEDGGTIGADGAPMLPTFSRMIQIPNRSGVSIEVIGIETTELEGYRPFPMQPDAGGDFLIDRAAYATAGFGDAPRVEIGEPAIARDLRVVPIHFSPVRYDPARGVLEVAQRIEVAVRFAGVDLRNAQPIEHPTMPPSFNNMYHQLVVNYEGPRAGQDISLGSYVIICPNNTTVLNKLAPLIEWRTRKGFEVYVATTAETGTTTTSIKAWIQNAYNTWESPPEYVCLVGDADGSVAIPCWYYGSGNTDHNYTQLDGTDILSDVFIGRISVESTDRLELYVNKIVSYESTPYMTDPGWYTRACVVGDPNGSGITCIQVMQWVKELLRHNGYTEVDTVFMGPWTTYIRAALNRGDTVFSYRGYWGHSGWTTADIMNLTNGRKMPYALSVTCGTGDFAGGTSYNEAWIRAGTPPNAPTGGIAAIATATLGTHTRFNNCVISGVWRGVFCEDMFTFGESFNAMKLALYTNYYDYDPGGCGNFTSWNNLMGDPAGEQWTGVPQTLSVSCPASLPLGANAVTATVTAGGFPIEGAYVCLWKGDETHVGGYTRADGTIEIPVSVTTAGDIKITVSKHNCAPYLGTIPVSQQTRFVGYSSHTVDDDAVGTSYGNGDHLPNPTERLELPVQVHNFGTQTATAVTGTISCSDPYVTITDNSEDFGDIAAGASAWSADDFDIQLAATTPSGHVVALDLDLSSGSYVWRSVIQVRATAAAFIYDRLTTYGVGGSYDPNEQGELSVGIRNVGDASGASITGTLMSLSPWVTVTDAVGGFGTIGVGATGENTSNRFGVRTSSECYRGHLANMRILLQFSSGVRDTVDFVLQVGTAGTTDPSRPDHYGYYAFDNTDTGYEEAPVYQWVEINPSQGGAGTDVGLNDNGADQDDSRTVDLPFDFVYYGETFDRVTICSNGWISMGATYLKDFINRTIPGAEAPPYMIAPMWDNLYQSGTDQVYQRFDAANHRYIVEYYNVRNDYNGATECFEVILYDPVYYPTATGDGIILFQYQTFNNSDGFGAFSTVGIENGDLTDGVLYSYYNRYTAGSATISTGRAIKFTTIDAVPRGTLSGVVTNGSNGGTPLPGVTVRIEETGQVFTSAENGTYGGAVGIGTYTVTATHASFRPDTAQGVVITEGNVTDLDFALEDIVAPVITATTQLPHTPDETGPYVVNTTVVDYSALARVELIYNSRGTGWVVVPMTSTGGNGFTASIPGQQQGSLIEYYIAAEDAGGLVAMDPPGAPEDTYVFWVLAPLLADDMETGSGDWTHYAVTGGFVDQWHQSQLRNHSPGGSWSWKFGDTDGGNYADLSDGALESGAVTLEGDATLSFWHWMASEVSGGHPGYAYDGGLVEMSVDGGPWTQITPVGGYPYLIRAGGNPGPFPPETPVFSGSFDWTQAVFDLTGVSGEARFRFRFGSDGATNAEGWYIDDLEIMPAGPGSAGAEDIVLLPTTTALYQNSPNPLRGLGGGTLIRFDLPKESAVRLDVFDVGGRLVRSLLDRTMPPGRHEVTWDCSDANNQRVDSGVYFYILKTANKTMSRRMLLVN